MADAENKEKAKGGEYNVGRPKNAVVNKHLEEKGKKFDSADWAMQQGNPPPDGAPKEEEEEKKP